MKKVYIIIFMNLTMLYFACNPGLKTEKNSQTMDGN